VEKVSFEPGMEQSWRCHVTQSSAWHPRWNARQKNCDSDELNFVGSLSLLLLYTDK